ncbi:peptidylprolyl isomerase [Tolypothrix sp. PCC 7910]|uniref:peptidylprolyl isomerase n=1 Tax=Tolypothrix sp. PCC 7910 TaxID=2099387 RepID=UPI000D210958|nr:peptidylprolyl isomerase [Tolypothrix sp. PCC 7910]AVH79437.1 PpiC-type peptidyl-prolyl cis-transl isomerase [Tolypothrix sp. PCC 7910]QIR37105.1 peptidylprolyl isomerase [Tolypothrix sp. PCC 7910]
MLDSIPQLTFPKITPASDEDILAYLRHSFTIATIAAAAEQNTYILKVCEHLGITVTDEELQAAGDLFRQNHKLLGVSETIAWLTQQRITAEDWTQGIRLSLLTQKLKEHLFGENVGAHYINNRDNYQRVALSQILVKNLTTANNIVQLLQANQVSFPALALEYSQGKQSKENGGFVGIRFLAELLPEIATAITDVHEGEIVGPIQTPIGYHILRIEKWLPANLSEIREEILESLFQAWLQTKQLS